MTDDIPSAGVKEAWTFIYFQNVFEHGHIELFGAHSLDKMGTA